MTRTVTLELPSELVERAHAVAARTRRPFEEVLVEWVSRGGALSVEELSDAEVLPCVTVNYPRLSRNN